MKKFRIEWGFEGRYITSIEAKDIEGCMNYILSQPKVNTIHGCRILKPKFVTNYYEV